MTEIIGVRFRGGPKEYYFDPRGIAVAPGEFVVVETAAGEEYGRCVTGNHAVEDKELVQPLRPLLRIATEADRKRWEGLREREKEALGVFREKAAQHGLDMKLVKVEGRFDGSKFVFYFTSDGRVDFRALVRDLASVFHTRIELRQIGVRDEAKMLGGIGVCGRGFCCAEFLDDFVPVSIKMAKTQGLSLNPVKISGSCGRLMCCLKYEQDAYEDAARRCPRQDSFVLTPDGTGNILNANPLREDVTVRLDDHPDSLKHYHISELSVLRNGRGSREGIEIPSERPARRATQPPEEGMSAMGGAPFYDETPDTPRENVGGKRRSHRGDRSRRKGNVGDPIPEAAAAPKASGKPQRPSKVGDCPAPSEGMPVKPKKDAPASAARRRSRRGGRRPRRGGASGNTPNPEV